MSDNMCEAAVAGSKKWQQYFNAGDAAGCASCYEQTATLVIKSYGKLLGRNSIEEFWAEQINIGIGEADYTDFVVMQIAENIAIVTGEWATNNTTGKIVYAMWARQRDGIARLRECCLEIEPALHTELKSLKPARNVSGTRIN